MQHHKDQGQRLSGPFVTLHHPMGVKTDSFGKCQGTFSWSARDKICEGRYAASMPTLAPLIDVLRAEPLLLLFVVAACGYVAGRVSIFGLRLGVAAVLFVGLGFWALDPALKLPEVLTLLGLLLFVYTIGLSSGQRFFASLRRRGLRDNLFIALMLLACCGVTVIGAWLLGLGMLRTTGVFCGSLTNTPALATVLQTIRTRPLSVREREQAWRCRLLVIRWRIRSACWG